MRFAWNSMLALCCGAIARAEVIYVDDTASGANDGSSWADAYVSLVDALSAARFGDQVWVAAGRYTPDPTPPYSRMATFSLVDGVTLFGGFDGTESSLTERAGLFAATELSGDLAGDDTASFVNVGENSFHVVSVQSGVRSGVDGFRIVGGNADGTSSPDDRGGAIRIDGASEIGILRCRFAMNQARREGGAIHASGALTVLIKHCEFRTNRIFDDPAWGGAVFAQNSSLSIVSSLFAENSVGQAMAKNSVTRGGAVCSFSSPTSITRSRFEKNRALGTVSSITGGGAVYTNSSLVLSDSDFVGNVIDSDDTWGGAVQVNGNAFMEIVVENCRFVANESIGQYASGGAIDAFAKVTLVGCYFAGNETRDTYSYAYGGAVAVMPSLVATNCVFVGNVAATGSAISGGSTTLVNCTIVGNDAHGPYVNGTTACQLTAGSHYVRNSVLVGNSWNGAVTQESQVQGAQIDFARNCIQGWNGTLGGIGNFDADPMFVDTDGPDGVFGTDDDDLRLSPGSPCLEAGDNALLPDDLADLDSDGIVNEPLPLDLDLGPRVWLSHVASPTGVGGPPIVDLGAYERHGDVCQSSVGYQGPGNLTLALCGEDLTQPDTHATLFVTEAPPSGSVWLVVGPALSALPVFGGVLAPAPILATFESPIDATGKAVVPISNRNTGPPIEWYLQGIAVNGASVAFSNTLAVLVAGP